MILELTKLGLFLLTVVIFLVYLRGPMDKWADKLVDRILKGNQRKVN